MPDLEASLRAYGRFVESQHRDLAVERITGGASPSAGPSRRRPPSGRRSRRLVAVAVVVAAVVVVGVIAVLARRQDAGVPVQTGPATTTTVEGGRVLYTHQSPDGSTVTAIAGNVPLQFQPTCTTVAVTDTTGCDLQPGQPATAPGVEFDFTIDGRTYHAFVLDQDPRLLPEPGQGVMIPLFADMGPDQAFAGRNLVVLHVTGQVARVRLPASGPGGAAPDGDEMAPVEGWVTFPIHNFDGLGNPEAFDAAGTSLGTSLPFPCC